jgi:3-phenylpropionate/trans-cinnamate dioxygenase ferredoxin reductase component
MTVEDSSIVIVGASLAGSTTAQELRNLGHRGPVTIIGAEAHAPYDRSLLSKRLLDPGPPRALPTLPTEHLDAEIVQDAAVRLDPDHRKVTLASGATRAFDALVIATGASARRLATPGQRGELVLRTADDAHRIGARLASARSAVVVGADFLGMEIVSACVRHGVRVTVIDSEPPLQRLFGPALSGLAMARAELAGVAVRVDRAGVSLLGDPVAGVRFSDGSELRADLVVTSAGDIANAGWLTDSGLEICDGVVIDELCRTNRPGVLAVGDVAAIRSPDGAERHPSWANAVRQAKVAAHAILEIPGAPPVLDDYRWTEFLNRDIRIVGVLPPAGDPEVVEGSLWKDAVLCWFGTSSRTAVSWGVECPLPELRALAAGAPDAVRAVPRPGLE